MNLKLTRSTRTPYSEEISIYDMETRDENDEPVSIGKIDVHYLDDQVVGTLLIWQEFATGYRQAHTPGSPESLDSLIDEILAEVSDPVGVSATYAVEVFYPPFAGQGFVSNYPDDENSDSGAPTVNDEEMGTAGEEVYDADEEPKENDFADKLRQRP